MLCTECCSRKTSGEKCLLVHILLALLVIITVGITLGIHFLLVEHRSKSNTTNIVNGRRTIKWISHLDIILNGETNIFEYNFMGAVVLNASKPTFICNAVIVHPLWVITSAHCTTIRTHPNNADALPFWLVKAGITSWSKPGEDGVSSILESFVHPSFDYSDYSYDLGLIRLASHLLFSNKIGAISFVNSSERALLKERQAMEVVGWGKFSYSDESYAMRIRAEQMILQAPVQCSGMMKFANKITLSNLCVIPRGNEEDVNFCHVGEGGALIKDKQLYGIGTWGEKCVGKELPVIFTDIDTHRQWIEKQMKWKPVS